MDFGKLAGQASGFLNKQTQQSTNPPAAQTQVAPAEGTAPPPTEGGAPAANTGGVAHTAGAGNDQQDYGDKAFGFISQKTGKTFDRDTSEKITDGARGAYEKATGSKVDAKYSN